MKRMNTDLGLFVVLVAVEESSRAREVLAVATSVDLGSLVVIEMTLKKSQLTAFSANGLLHRHAIGGEGFQKTYIGITLDPGLASRVTRNNDTLGASKNSSHGIKRDILQDERTRGLGSSVITISLGPDGLTNPRELAIKNGKRSSVGIDNINTDFAVLNNKRLVSPTPIPKLADSSLAAVELKVPSSVLLVAQPSTNGTTTENEIVQQAAGTLLDQHTDMLRARGGGEAELDVGERCGLGRGPVKTDSVGGGGDGGGVDDDVVQLAEEDIDGDPGEAIGAVAVAIDDAESGGSWEVGGGLDHGAVGRVADDLGVVVVDDRVGDKVSSIVKAVSDTWSRRFLSVSIPGL